MDLIVFEDAHLLVIDKPAGWNTHAPSPFANKGLYEWLKHREPRWASLAILHRLDKETSGLIVFGKTAEANRSLTQQFENREVAKKYLLLTDRSSPRSEFVAKSNIDRAGDKYKSLPSGSRGQPAETRFKFISTDEAGLFLWEAEPLTGRTHQIRVHAADHGIPIFGDVLYHGSVAPRICLHAAQLAFKHPAANLPLTFRAAPRFSEPVSARLRSAIIDPSQTNAVRLVHGAADGWPGLYVDRWDDFLLASSGQSLSPAQLQFTQSLPARGLYHKTLQRQPGSNSPRHISGEHAPSEGFVIRENGLKFKIRFDEGYSVGLFLDQRDNRRRLLNGYVSADLSIPPPTSVLNVFAYTCAFSVCAAARGAKVTSIDLSRKYLDWGRENFLANNLSLDGHDFIYGDALQWFARLARKKRLFDLILLDPPTFSRSKEGGLFQADKDYGRLISSALTLLVPGGTLFASTNAATYDTGEFLTTVTKSIQNSARRIASQHYVPQPPDFPIHPTEPAYLKTVWIKLVK
jgi:23S rRNA (cytosine1962-C5)-methyltransferase